MSCVNVTIGLGMNAVCASCRSLDDCIPWRFPGVALPVGVYFSYSTDCVERQCVWADADDRTLLYLSMGARYRAKWTKIATHHISCDPPAGYNAGRLPESDKFPPNL